MSRIIFIHLPFRRGLSCWEMGASFGPWNLDNAYIVCIIYVCLYIYLLLTYIYIYVRMYIYIFHIYRGSHATLPSQGLMRLAMSAFDYSDTSAHGAFNVFRVETLLKVPRTRHIWSSDPAISIMT